MGWQDIPFLPHPSTAKPENHANVEEAINSTQNKRLLEKRFLACRFNDCGFGGQLLVHDQAA